jgi:hypothetical protein
MTPVCGNGDANLHLQRLGQRLAPAASRRRRWLQLMDDLVAGAIAAACPVAGFAGGCGLWLVRVRFARPVVRQYVERLGYQVLRMRPRLFRAWFRRDPLPLSWAPFAGATAYQGVVFRVLIRDRGGREREIWVQSRGWFAPKLENVSHIDWQR